MMKVVIAGATGFIGGEVLRQLLLNPAVTSVLSIGRRNLPDTVAKDPKLKHVVTEDMGSYSDSVLQEMAGADACIWAIGGMVSKIGSFEQAQKINVEYPLVLAKLFATHATLATKEGKRFRFVYTSGALTERELEKKLWFLSESRKMKGEVENKMIELEKGHSDKIEVFFPRPAGVLATNFGLTNTAMGPFALGNEELGASIVDIILNGSDEQVLENATLRSHGRELLKKGN